MELGFAGTLCVFLPCALDAADEVSSYQKVMRALEKQSFDLCFRVVR
jgi:hypothetical protein